MVKPLHETGVEIDGFRLEAMVHRGGKCRDLATLVQTKS